MMDRVYDFKAFLTFFHGNKWVKCPAISLIRLMHQNSVIPITPNEPIKPYEHTQCIQKF